jgi:hypothetical protein
VRSQSSSEFMSWNFIPLPSSHLQKESCRSSSRMKPSGFDPTCVPDTRAIENIVSETDRGIHLMKTLMGVVHFEHGGTELRLHKGFERRPGWSFKKSRRTFEERPHSAIGRAGPRTHKAERN